jgi:hypothetical protein
MRRPVRLAGALALALAVGAPAGSAAQAPAQDSVTGSASAGEGRASVEFTFDVRSDAAGENPTGTVRFNALLADFGYLEVSCLTVSGNRASMIVLFPPVPAAPAGVSIFVEDNDGAAQGTLRWNVVTTLPTGCPVSTLPGEPIRAGDVTVTDAPRLPASKAECSKAAGARSESSRTRATASGSWCTG